MVFQKRMQMLGSVSWNPSSAGQWRCELKPITGFFSQAPCSCLGLLEGSSLSSCRETATSALLYLNGITIKANAGDARET